MTVCYVMCVSPSGHTTAPVSGLPWPRSRAPARTIRNQLLAWLTAHHCPTLNTPVVSHWRGGGGVVGVSASGTELTDCTCARTHNNNRISSHLSSLLHNCVTFSQKILILTTGSLCPRNRSPRQDEVSWCAGGWGW